MGVPLTEERVKIEIVKRLAALGLQIHPEALEILKKYALKTPIDEIVKNVVSNLSLIHI